MFLLARASILDLSTSDCKATDSPDGKVPPTWTLRRRDSGSMAVCFGESACRKLTLPLGGGESRLRNGRSQWRGVLAERLLQEEGEVLADSSQLQLYSL